VLGLPRWGSGDELPVQVILADTGQTLDGGPTTASRQTYITGNAVRLAALKVRETLARVAAEELDASPEALRFEDGYIAAGEKRLTLGEAARLARKQGLEPRASEVYEAPKTVPIDQEGPHHFAYGFATQAALVEVDTETGEVKVLKVIAAHDVGKAISPLGVIGQIEGGVVMGIGLALKEEFVVEGGEVKTTSFRQYRIPTVKDIPEIVPIIVEAPASEGPFGAKGIGEIPSIPTAPAIANAVYHACGVRVYELPIRLNHQDTKTRRLTG